MQEGYWIIRTYEAGSVGEKIKFWVPGTRPSKVSRRCKSEIKKQEQNEYSAVKQLARLINANFTKGDFLLGLDYSESGMQKLEQWAEQENEDFVSAPEEERLEMIRTAAEREMRLVLRRVKRELSQSADLKYIAVTSDMDGDTGEFVRVHHHLIIPKEAKEAFVKKWGDLGGVSWNILSEQDDYTPIAEYMLRQVRRIPDAKKYVSSRNLIRPQPRDRVAVSDAELRVPQGAKLLHRNEFKPGRPQYIRYTLPESRRRSPSGVLHTSDFVAASAQSAQGQRVRS